MFVHVPRSRRGADVDRGSSAAGADGQVEGGRRVEYSGRSSCRTIPAHRRSVRALGLCDPADRKRLVLNAPEVVAARSTRDAKFQILACVRRTSIIWIYEASGWHPAEVDPRTRRASGSGRRRPPRMSFKNPKKTPTRCICETTRVPDLFTPAQQVALEDRRPGRWARSPPRRRRPTHPDLPDRRPARDWRTVNLVLDVDRTFKPGSDPRELGIRVFPRLRRTEVGHSTSGV